MRSLPRPARTFIVAVIGGYFVMTLVAAQFWPTSLTAYLPTAAAFLVAATVAEHFAIPMLRGGFLSVSTVPHIAAALLLPAPLAILVAVIGIVLQQAISRESLHKLLFNASATALSVGVTSLVSRALLGPGLLSERPGIGELFALAAASVGYLGVNSLLTASIVGLASKRSIWFVLVDQGKRTLVPEFAIAILGGLLAFVWIHSPIWSLVVILPVAVAHLTIDYLYRNETETAAAVKTMAKTIDERDHYTYFHSSNVARYAEALAEEMRLPPSEIELVASAAGVHDLGKIGVTDQILHKPGPLNEIEFAEMKSHPVVGARILSHFRSYRDGVQYVLHHHERWDGRGYPNGLKGERIPLGARIIAVADAFDAMTTNRPYRPRLSQDEALRRLQEGSGRQFDPVVVAHFVRVIERTDFGRVSQPIPLRHGHAHPDPQTQDHPDGPVEREAC